MTAPRRFWQKIKYLTTFTLLFASTLLCFQNCGEVSISAKINAAENPSILQNPSKPSANICSPEGATFGSPIRVAIVLDMSFSNVGTMISDGNSPTNWSKDTTYATDTTGQRISQIRDFIDQCGSSRHVSYSVIGFGTGALFSPTNSCLSPFESQANALVSMDFFKGMQDHDIKTSVGVGPSPFLLQGGTSYDSALRCLDQKINEDMSKNIAIEKPSYYTMMLTDGRPEENSSSNITTAQYLQSLTNIKLAVNQNATSLHFFPIYYGASEQAATAKATLDQLAHVVDPMQKTLELSGNNLAQIKNHLCQQIKPQSIVQYELKTIYAVNMNALMRKNILFADTDADGLTDDEEISRGGMGAGFDPQDSHSSGILDSLCAIRGLDKASCAKLINSSCTGQPAALGFRGCDLAAASTVFGLKLTGVDSEGDLIPDFLEILRSTSPARADALETPLSDGKTNFEKITAGLDIESSLSSNPVRESDLVKVTYSEELAGSCGSGKTNYLYELEQIPLLAVPAYTDKSPSGPVDFSHGRDENVVLVFSIWQASGGLTMPDRLYVQKILIPLKGEIQFVDKSPKLVGEILL